MRQMLKTQMAHKMNLMCFTEYVWPWWAVGEDWICQLHVCRFLQTGRLWDHGSAVLIVLSPISVDLSMKTSHSDICQGSPEIMPHTLPIQTWYFTKITVCCCG